MFKKVGLGMLESMLVQGNEVLVVEHNKFDGTNFTTYGKFDSIDGNNLILKDTKSLPFAINATDENYYCLKDYFDHSNLQGHYGVRDSTTIEFKEVKNLVEVFMYKEFNPTLEN